MADNTVTAARPADVAARTRARSFHFWLGWFYLLLVVLGFAKSFYLRPFFENRGITADVYVHGIVLTAWFALFALQVSLVAGRRLALHRRLGRWSGWLAALIVVTSLPVAYLRPARLVGNPPPGYDFAADIPHLGVVVLGNTGFLLLFVIFFALAIRWRTHADSHKRLMSLAAYCILGPAIGRLATLWGTAGETSTSAASVIVGLGIPAAMIAHDVVTRRAVHPVNAVGVPVVMAWLAGSYFLSGRVGEPFIRWLSTAL